MVRSISTAIASMAAYFNNLNPRSKVFVASFGLYPVFVYITQTYFPIRSSCFLDLTEWMFWCVVCSYIYTYFYGFTWHEDSDTQIGKRRKDSAGSCQGDVSQPQASLLNDITHPLPPVLEYKTNSGLGHIVCPEESPKSL